jgi:hypothetical protein
MLITSGVAATAGLAGLTAAARLAQRYGLIPPDDGGIYGPGRTLTYAAQRLLTTHSLARVPAKHDLEDAIRQLDRASERSLQAPSGQRVRGLAAFGRRIGRPARIPFPVRPQESSRSQPNHRGRMRGGLVIYR